MRSLYFGAVEVPEGAEVRHFSRDLWDWREWERLEARLRRRRPVWSQAGDGIYAAAYRTRRKGVARLVVECPAGGGGRRWEKSSGRCGSPPRRPSRGRAAPPATGCAMTRRRPTP